MLVLCRLAWKVLPVIARGGKAMPVLGDKSDPSDPANMRRVSVGVMLPQTHVVELSYGITG